MPVLNKQQLNLMNDMNKDTAEIFVFVGVCRITIRPT